MRKILHVHVTQSVTQATRKKILSSNRSRTYMYDLPHTGDKIQNHLFSRAWIKVNHAPTLTISSRVFLESSTATR